MVLQALAAAEMAMHDCGVNIELGSGVAAAQKKFIDETQTLKSLAA